MGLIQSIRDGKYDESLDRIQQAVLNRRKVLGQERFYDLRVGSRVKFIDTVRPQYLQGAIGRVTSKRLSKVVVQLDRPVGRFRGGIVTRAELLVILPPEAIKPEKAEESLGLLEGQIADILNRDSGRG